MSNELTTIEREEFATFETVIESGLRTFKDVGNALMEIRDGRMYRSEFGTFEEYCDKRWGFNASRARQFIMASEVVTNIESVTMVTPANERQARPLTTLPPEKQPEAWKAATDKAENEGRKVTAKDVQEEVKKIKTENAEGEVLPPEKKEKRRPIKPPSDGMQFARIAIMNLEQIKNDDSERVESFAVVKDWIIKNES
jgi:hypothetical protein